MSETHNRADADPVWCICEVEDRVGLVSRLAYDKASREANSAIPNRPLRPVASRTGPPHLLRIDPEYVIIVGKNTREFWTISWGLTLERRTFFVPPLSSEKKDLKVAYKQVHGSEWDEVYQEFSWW